MKHCWIVLRYNKRSHKIVCIYKAVVEKSYLIFIISFVLFFSFLWSFLSFVIEPKKLVLEYHDSFFLSLLYKHELCMFDIKTSSYTSWSKKNIESYWKCVCIWMKGSKTKGSAVIYCKSKMWKWCLYVSLCLSRMREIICLISLLGKMFLQGCCDLTLISMYKDLDLYW